MCLPKFYSFSITQGPADKENQESSSVTIEEPSTSGSSTSCTTDRAKSAESHPSNTTDHVDENVSDKPLGKILWQTCSMIFAIVVKGW